MANRQFVGFRLRKNLDDDLKDALKGMDSTAISELARNGLRWALGIRSHKVVEILERPLRQPKVWMPKR